MGVGIQVENLNAWYGKGQALFDINLKVGANRGHRVDWSVGMRQVDFIRCINRMHETIPEARVEGRVHIGEIDAYNGTSATQLRRRVGMVFQKANPFPTMSIYDNVRLRPEADGFRNRRKLDEICRTFARFGGAMGRSKRSDTQTIRSQPLRRPAAAPVHCARPRRRTRGSADGRALFGTRSDF